MNLWNFKISLFNVQKKCKDQFLLKSGKSFIKGKKTLIAQIPYQHKNACVFKDELSLRHVYSLFFQELEAYIQFGGKLVVQS